MYEVSVFLCSPYELSNKISKEIDLYLFTEEIPKDFAYKKNALNINVILNSNDLVQLVQRGLEIKKYSFDLLNIESKLSFLDEEQRRQVINIINDNIKENDRFIQVFHRRSIYFNVYRGSDYIEYYNRKIELNESVIMTFAYQPTYDVHIEMYEREGKKILMLKTRDAIVLLESMFYLYKMMKSKKIQNHTLFQDIKKLVDGKHYY